MIFMYDLMFVGNYIFLDEDFYFFYIEFLSRVDLSKLVKVNLKYLSIIIKKLNFFCFIDFNSFNFYLRVYI